MGHLLKWHQTGSTFTLKDYQEPLTTKSMSFFLKSSYLLACVARPYPSSWNSLLGDCLPWAFYTFHWVCREWKYRTTLCKTIPQVSTCSQQPEGMRNWLPLRQKIQPGFKITITWQVPHSSTITQLTECADIHLDPLASPLWDLKIKDLTWDHAIWLQLLIWKNKTFCLWSRSLVSSVNIQKIVEGYLYYSLQVR